MKTNKLYAGLIAAVAMGTTALHAWDGCGHEIVATIAYEQLPPAVKAKVDKVFANDPRGRTFIDAATWPDDIKPGKRNDAPSAPLNKIVALHRLALRGIARRDRKSTDQLWHSRESLHRENRHGHHGYHVLRQLFEGGARDKTCAGRRA